MSFNTARPWPRQRHVAERRCRPRNRAEREPKVLIELPICHVYLYCLLPATKPHMRHPPHPLSGNGCRCKQCFFPWQIWRSLVNYSFFSLQSSSYHHKCPHSVPMFSFILALLFFPINFLSPLSPVSPYGLWLSNTLSLLLSPPLSPSPWGGLYYALLWQSTQIKDNCLAWLLPWYENRIWIIHSGIKVSWRLLLSDRSTR